MVDDRGRRLRTARGRTASSQRWLRRQLTDPYVRAARQAGYRSRAAWKLSELDDKLKFLKPGVRVADLGAAPGGWTQVAVERVNALGKEAGARGAVVAVDLSPVEPVEGAAMLQADATLAETAEAVRAALGGRADVVLSDMAPAATGHRATDHLRSMALCEAALAFAHDALAPGGAMVVKTLMGGTESSLLAGFKRCFASVRHIKPAASRRDSAEMYLVATGYRPGHGEQDGQGGEAE